MMLLSTTTACSRPACKTTPTCSSATSIVKLPTSFSRRLVLAQASAAVNDTRNDSFSVSRRAALLAVPAGALLVQAGTWTGPARAELQGYKTFLGYNQAPDLYLGYGAAQDSPPLYSFEYPADWDEAVVTKTDKSTMGMDGMVKHPKTRKEQAYVIALGGKDYRDSVLKDAKTSLIVVAGGDPDLRQAVTDGQVKQIQKTINGTPMYTYEINSDKRTYLSTVGKKGDTVYALVVSAPKSAFENDADSLHHIQDSFKLL